VPLSNVVPKGFGFVYHSISRFATLSLYGGGVWVGRNAQSAQMDRFLHTLILYFLSYFQLYALQRSKKVRAPL
jgi:hypothetical protein